MKFLLDKGMPLPKASLDEIRQIDSADRLETGRRLLSRFLADAQIRGATPEGHVFEHAIDEALSQKFLKGLAAIEVRGTR